MLFNCGICKIAKDEDDNKKLGYEVSINDFLVQGPTDNGELS